VHPIPNPITAAQQAWVRLKDHQSWSDWKAVGAAITEGRTKAMALARTNKPEGRRYNMEFGAWLAAHSFDDLEGTARKRLLQCMENIAAIETWLATLEIAKRLRLNHPATVLSAWKQTTAAPKSVAEKPSPDLVAAWQMAPATARAEFLTVIGTPALLEAMSKAQRDELEGRAFGSIAAHCTTKKERATVRKLGKKRPYMELQATPIT
jgi:hypothetical protein